MAKSKAKGKVKHFDRDKMREAYLKNHDLNDVVATVHCSRVYAHRRATLDGYFVRPGKKVKAANAGK